MKRTILFLSLVAVVLIGCQKEEEPSFQETGVVVDYAGAGNCSFVIELDNGKRIQPLHFPDEFNFVHGQRVLVEYRELENTIPSCDRGTPCDVLFAEELSCAPWVDLYFSNYDSLARDPIFLHEAFVDGDCLQLKISYSGGCKEHTVDLAYMHQWNPGSNDIPTFEIRHDSKGDLCEGLITREYRFDLTPLIIDGETEFVLTAKLNGGDTYSKIFELE